MAATINSEMQRESDDVFRSSYQDTREATFQISSRTFLSFNFVTTTSVILLRRMFPISDHLTALLVHLLGTLQPGQQTLKW